MLILILIIHKSCDISLELRAKMCEFYNPDHEVGQGVPTQTKWIWKMTFKLQLIYLSG